MSVMQFVWVGDLDARTQVLQNPDALNHDRCHPKRMLVKTNCKETRIGRKNSKKPPDYALESAVSNRMISRNHVTIERLSKGNFMLYDHSLNGTYVNFVRVIGGTILKHDDIVCFGHINGANIKPGENVTPFATDLKYRVEIFEEPNKDETYSQSDSSVEDEHNKIKSSKFPIKNKRQKPSQVSDMSEQSSNESDGENLRKKKKVAELSSLSSSEEDTNMVNRFKSQKFSKKGHHSLTDSRFNDSASSVGKKRKSMTLDQSHKSNHYQQQHRKSGGNQNDNMSGSGSIKRNDRSLSSSINKDRGGMRMSGSSGNKSHSSSKNKYSTEKSKRNNNNMNSSYEYEECSAKHCARPDGDAVIDWIMCDKCSQWYHQYCVGLDEPLEDDENYYCPNCS